jgi:hypothetical protein
MASGIDNYESPKNIKLYNRTIDQITMNNS